MEEFIQSKMDQNAAKMKRYNFQDTVSENDNLFFFFFFFFFPYLFF